MTREFVYTQPFRNAWSMMGLCDEDLKLLEEILLSNIHAGDVISGTGGARKMRIQLYGKGKSGGARVIYVDIFEKEKLYLLFAYPKSVQENLTPSQTKIIKNLVEAIKKE